MLSGMRLGSFKMYQHTKPMPTSPTETILLEALKHGGSLSAATKGRITIDFGGPDQRLHRICVAEALNFYILTELTTLSIKMLKDFAAVCLEQ